MTSAVKKIVDYAFDKYKLLRISAEPYETSMASIRVLDKAGFIKEGVKRSSAYKEGRVLDQVVFARTRVVAA